jgi:hypothetical protein
VKDKYSVKSETELIAALTDLILNIQNNKESGYYTLPSLETMKTWEELFPSSEKVQ